MRGMMISMEELMRAEREDADEPPAPAPLPEAVVADLRELHERYRRGCEFSPGDLVSPRRGYGITGEGKPHVVLEVRRPAHAGPTPFPDDDCSAVGSPLFGQRLDLRVATLATSRRERYVAAYWGESWKYEPWPSTPSAT